MNTLKIENPWKNSKRNREDIPRLFGFLGRSITGGTFNSHHNNTSLKPAVPHGTIDPKSIMASSKPPKDLIGQFPAPTIIQPQQEHRQTLIILHGRGSYASKFGPPLLETTVDGQTLQSTFPHAKIIFPTAAKSKATIY